MSTKYPGGIITKDYVAPTPTSASGIWTLEQQEQAKQAGIWPYGGPFNYIEDVFSTWLTSGTGASQSVANGINLSTYGGLIWEKLRGPGTQNHSLTDTARGLNAQLNTNSTGTGTTSTSAITAFNTNGFNFGTAYSGVGDTNVFWTFRKQPKFFDIVTYTGNGTSQNIAHNLGSVPGCIIVKSTSDVNNWFVYHTSLGATNLVYLNATSASASSTIWNNTSPTSTQFSVNGTASNNSGSTYVAYLFANNAGGFGLTGTDNVISCGSWTASASAVPVNLGYEPQYVLVKNASAAQNWFVWDTMRGMPVDSAQPYLYPNLSDAEASDTYYLSPTATGFTVRANALGTAGNTYIYIAIRRGPMKIATDPTKVFEPTAYTGNNASNRIIGSLSAGDSALVFTRNYSSYSYPQTWWARLTGGFGLRPYSINAQVDQSTTLSFANQLGQLISNGSQNINFGGSPAGNFVLYNFKRAPGFFDVVCYTGTGSATTFNHNLGVAPELMIVKNRTNAAGYGWPVYSQSIPNSNYLFLSDTRASTAGTTIWNSTSPTTTVFTVGTNAVVNQSGDGYIAYLFATCAGVSKVGSYTGNATLTTINCGFTGGARFVLIKRTDTTSNWFIWDTARGMVAGTDPVEYVNATGDEVNANSVYTIATGFQLLAAPSADVNTNGGTYIYLAIA